MGWKSTEEVVLYVANPLLFLNKVVLKHLGHQPLFASNCLRKSKICKRKHDDLFHRLDCFVKELPPPSEQSVQLVEQCLDALHNLLLDNSSTLIALKVYDHAAHVWGDIQHTWETINDS